MFKRTALIVLALFVLSVGTSAATSYLLTTVPIRNYGPFIVMGSGNARDSTGVGSSKSVGGLVTYYTAKSTDTLKIGDVVFLDTLSIVAKSATLANYNKVVGVVVGGRSTSMQGAIASADVGSTAALPNQAVIVLQYGRAWVKTDTQVAGVTTGTGLRISTFNAGLVQPRGTILDSLYRVIGKSVSGGAASTAILANIFIK